MFGHHQCPQCGKSYHTHFRHKRVLLGILAAALLIELVVPLFSTRTTVLLVLAGGCSVAAGVGFYALISSELESED